jgi:hypothetical protein
MAQAAASGRKLPQASATASARKLGKLGNLEIGTYALVLRGAVAESVVQMQLGWLDDRAAAAIANETQAAAQSGSCSRPCFNTIVWLPGDAWWVAK